MSLRCNTVKVNIVSYRLRTALRTGQPPPFFQNVHQSHDSHLTLRRANHVEEALRRRGQGQVTKEEMDTIHHCLCF